MAFSNYPLSSTIVIARWHRIRRVSRCVINLPSIIPKSLKALPEKKLARRLRRLGTSVSGRPRFELPAKLKSFSHDG
jgi:hypothetical protein